MDAKAPHDQALVIKNSDNTPAPEFKTSDVLNGGRRFVRFEAAGKTVYAKLHIIKVEQRVNTVYVDRAEFQIGQEILEPGNGNPAYQFTPIPPQSVKEIKHHSAKIKIGNDWHDVVTNQQLVP
ncbi:MAG: hypothetical protein WKF77_18970 [Planctomycetaceae bacterium]